MPEIDVYPFTAPNFVGMTFDAAVAAAQDIYGEATALIPAGIVLSQFPLAGADVDPGIVFLLVTGLTPASVTVIAYAAGYFANTYQNIGDSFEITSAAQYSPYWMILVDTPPTDWLPYMATFDAYIDREMLEFGLPA